MWKTRVKHKFKKNVKEKRGGVRRRCMRMESDVKSQEESKGK